MKLILTKELLICLLFVLTFCACSSMDSRFENRDFTNKPVNLKNEQERQKFEEISREIEKNRSLWREKNISNYDFVCERRVEGVGGDFTVTINVRGNEALPVKDNEKNRFTVKDINDFPYYKEINSIEKLFDFTQRMLEEGWRVNVTFDTQYGFPKDVGIKTDGTGWISIKVKQLEIVE